MKAEKSTSCVINSSSSTNALLIPSMVLHHIGYAVKHLQDGINSFSCLGYKRVSPSVPDEARAVEICFLEKDGIKVELVAPLRKGSPIDKALASGTGMPYHFCYEVNSLQGCTEVLIKNGFAVLFPPSPAPACDNRLVSFLFEKTIGIIELIERNIKDEADRT
ncbi:MAG: VOC family protein [Kiritimatiellae bacterium]|nr:VOC family protein [Kiritimatiellia bacterium]